MGGMPSVAVRAVTTLKFGKSYSSPKTVALDSVNQTAMNDRPTCVSRNSNH